MLSGEVRTQFDCSARSAKESGREPDGRARWVRGVIGIISPARHFFVARIPSVEFERCERSATANPANLNEELLNACSLGGVVPICRPPWNALMAGGPQTSAK